jgi:hypothetical protein
VLLAVPALAAVAPMSSAFAAVGLSRADLQSGQLRVEGSGAVPNHLITVSPGNVTGTSDSKGAFKIQSTPYSSATCKVSVTDGTTTSAATLAGCTPSSPAPAPAPAPAPVPAPAPAPTGPGISFTPTSVTFPAQTVGTTSAGQTVTVTNTGSAALFFNRVSTTGVADLDYTLVNDQCVGLSIPAGGTCTETIDFHPTADGSRPITVLFTDNAPASPQALPVNGTGSPAGTGPTPLTFDLTGTPSCTTGSVCDVNGGSPLIIGNFFAGLLNGRGGTAPYTYSATGLPAGLTVTPNGLLSGVLPTTTGTPVFTATVADAVGAVSSQQYSLTLRTSPASGDPACQKAPGGKEALTGPAIAGRTPTGQAIADESQLTACGGYTILNVSVSNVNLPDGTVLWVYLGGGAVGTVTLHAGTATMRPFNLGGVAPRFASVSLIDGPPPIVPTQSTIVSGGNFI